MLAERVMGRLNWEARLLGHEKPCLLWLDTVWLLEWRCTERATLPKGIKGWLLLEECVRGAAGLRVEHRCLFFLNRGEEVLHSLGAI